MSERSEDVRTARVIGAGRAGSALAGALAGTGRWFVVEVLGRRDDPSAAAMGVDLLVLAVPDPVVAEVAASVAPLPATVVAHMAGALGLDVLAPHDRRAVLHPLASLPPGELGPARLPGVWWGLSTDGDPLADEVVADLGGRALHVADADRARYHAAAAIAANHVVALLGQVERIAVSIGVPLEAYLPLVRTAVDNVAALGPAGALTGPVARRDTATVQRHLAALPPEERPAYEALVEQAQRLR
jgi:predicted short-subunit dehydrogenase-like oxidoreductase (DUF2520 family)